VGQIFFKGSLGDICDKFFFANVEEKRAQCTASKTGL
jgi:hypothetical protein